MRLKQLNEEVFFASDPLVQVSPEDVEFLKENMARTGRLRSRVCAHPDAGDPLHEMFIVVKKDAYVRPHKHLTKVESLLVLEGLADAVFFDDEGAVADVIEMGEYAAGQSLKFFYRIAKPVYHTLIIHSDFLVFKEVGGGPFDKADTAFPAWAPAESDSASGRDYLKKVEHAAELFLKKKNGKN